MPTYDYKCSSKECKHREEIIHKITENPEIVCSLCGEKMVRMITGGHFVLKGNNWFGKKDNKKGGY